jgi:NADH dehydrogenase
MAARARVVILGGGFGGLSAARALDGKPVDVTVIDRTNHHVFQPLLYQVATAALAPSDITSPIRWILRRQRNVSVLLGDVRAVDTGRREVLLDDDVGPVPYDYLIVATGARHAYFGHEEWEPLAPGLKSIEDALEIRRRFLLAFERAERTDDAAEREALMTFVIVGGGPTGVELAGMIAEIARRALPRDFRRIDTRRARIILVEGGPRVLPALPESLSAHATRDLVDLGVEVMTRSTVTAIDELGVRFGSRVVASRTVIWAAGNQASGLALSLDAPLDAARRVLVAPDLSVPSHPEVFVVGDLAAVKRTDGSWVPGVAPAANQEGALAARNVLRRVRDEPTAPFRYLDKGDLATIGRNRAVVSFHGVRLAGVVAWTAWLFVHIFYLIGFRNRAIVMIQWAYSYFTLQRGVRLITEADSASPPLTGAWKVPVR